MNMILSPENVDTNKLIFEGTNVCEDFEWNDTCDEISNLMGKTKTWYAEVINFGWRKTNGQQRFKAETGRKLLAKILPGTECNFSVYRYGKNGIAINNIHHDSPTGDEWYYIVPLSNKIKTKIGK